MTGKLVGNLIVLVVLCGIAAIGIFTGLIAIADQYIDAAGWHDEYTGRGAVFFGAACCLGGLAFLCFYLSTWFASKTFIIMGIMYIVGTFSIGRIAPYIPDFVLNEHVVPPVQSIVQAYVRPIFEMINF